jgi:hypothetical protein
MGLFNSCLRKRNKVGVVSLEEEEAYKKINREAEQELLEDKAETVICRLENAKATNITSDTKIEKSKGGEKAVTEIVKAKGGVAFDVNFQSKVPKLPPIFQRHQIVEDYEKWKGILSLSLSLLNFSEYSKTPQVVFRKCSFLLMMTCSTV